jgi:predicted DNA-binding transcriptional regulator YafY
VGDNLGLHGCGGFVTDSSHESSGFVQCPARGRRRCDSQVTMQPEWDNWLDYEVVVDFDPWATDLLRGRTWHASQEFTELPDGSSRLRLRLNAIEEMERWVLSWGVHAIVVRPKALAERIRKTAEDLVGRYSETA